MYNDNKLQKKIGEVQSEDDFDFCNTETGQKYTIKWSPSEDLKFISKHRFPPVKALSKSVPRRKRSLFQYKINRSLNFEIGISGTENSMKAKNFNSDESMYNERCLSRSAKILRSLNISFTPPNAGTKRINKSLNFDLSPSPKKIFSSAESIHNMESPKFHNKTSSMPRISKTLNFSSSSIDSNLGSLHSISADSIDENQNQTPSHGNRKVKKSLNYMSSSPRVNFTNSLRKSVSPEDKFISNATCAIETPNIHSIKQSNRNMTAQDAINASTPRNLLQDFEEDDKGIRPCTPVNVIQFVPESMSAIKKSHKKERHSHRLQKSHFHRSQERFYVTQNMSEESMILSQSTERPATPILNNSYPSPNYSVNSIKQSHKKDKSKKKSFSNHSDDEISDSGSIFDYIEEQRSSSECQPLDDSENNSSPMSDGSSGFRPISSSGSYAKNDVESSVHLVEDHSDHGSIFNYDVDKIPAAESGALDDSESDTNILNISHNSDCKPNCKRSCQANNNNASAYLNNSVEEISGRDSSFEYLNSRASSDRAETSEIQLHTPLSKKWETTSEAQGISIVSKEIQPNDESAEAIKSNSPSEENSCGPREIEISGTDQNETQNVDRPTTPKNVIDVMDQVRTDSIKRSHKKIKDMNKRILYKGHSAEQDPCTSAMISICGNNEPENSELEFDPKDASVETVSRSNTPENINSSRLLLGQYSSVKKSHKKNKFKKTISEFTKRQKYFNAEDQSESSKAYRSIDAKRRKSVANESFIDLPIMRDESSFTTPDKSSVEKRPVESSSNDASPLERATPNKRKKSFSLNDTSISTSSLDISQLESSSADYESAEEEFKIFTPIKKRKSAKTTANVGEQPGSSVKIIHPEHPMDNEIARCKTPTTNRETDYESCDNISSNSNRSIDHCAREEQNLANCKENVAPSKTDNNDGRSTPLNQSIAELIFDINSIKKSHKKDKRNFKIRRTLYNNEENDSRDLEVRHDSESSVCCEMTTPNDVFSTERMNNPEPSTSHGGAVMNKQRTNSLANVTSNVYNSKTPPNSLRVINYLQLRQADSIKRSHKKMRDRKRHISVTEDAESSDNGSIFDHSETIDLKESRNSMRNDDENNILDTKGEPVGMNESRSPQQLVQTPPNKSELSSMIESIKKSHKKVREYKRSNTRDLPADHSDDGSLFDPDEKLDESNDDVNDTEVSRDIFSYQ